MHGMVVARLCGLLAVMSSGVLGKGGGGGNSCHEGQGFCVQWTNHSANPYSTMDPMGNWRCKHGQIAVGYPDEIIQGMQDASGNPLPPRVNPSRVYEPDSDWVDENTESGRCRGCGCQCDVEYKCACVSREIADEGNQNQLNVLYFFTVMQCVLFICAMALMSPLVMQIGAEQEFCRSLIEERKANVAAAANSVANPVALQAAYNVPAPNVTPGMTVAVVIPEGMEPGQQMSVDPDGPQGPLPPVLVSIPDGMKAGDTMQVTVPAPVQQAAPVTAAVPYNSMQGMMTMQSKMPGPLGGPNSRLPGAMGRTPGPEFNPPPGYDPNKQYDSGPMGCWRSYPLTSDHQLQQIADSRAMLYGKYLSLPSCLCCIASVLCALCVVLQPEENEYYTGCEGNANSAVSSATSMATKIAAVVAVLLTL